MTLKCLSDGVPTPTLSWYKPEGSEINRVRARENKVQVPLRGDQDFGHYKCIAANGLIPSDEKLIKITQISKSTVFTCQGYKCPTCSYRCRAIRVECEIRSVQ